MRQSFADSIFVKKCWIVFWLKALLTACLVLLPSPTLSNSSLVAMVKAMKAMKRVSSAAKGRAMPKGELFGAIESTSGIKKKEVKAVFGALESLIPAQLKASGKFTIPGITMIKLKKKPATKAGKRMAFGKEVFVKAKPARTLVKCYTVKALKDAF